MYYILMGLCLIILGKAFLSFQWGKGVIILILWGAASGLLSLGGIGYAIMILMNIFLLKWLNRENA